MLQLILAYLLLLAFFLTEVFIRKDRGAKSIRKTKDDNKSTIFLAVVLSTVLILSEVFNFLRLGTFSNRMISIAGLVIMIIGLFIRIWSMLALRAYYTRTLRTTAHQQLIKKGPYRSIRHPGYLGTLLIWCPAGLAMQNLFVFILAIILIPAAYVYRIRNEERMLAKQFDGQYVEYRKHSWRLLPFIW
jgi:protein-S-isoprenylcysteine O-methyltransferase